MVAADGGPLTVGTVTVRMLDGVEQHQWYPNNPDYRMWRTGSATTEPPTALLEITSIGPRNEWFFPPRESVERLLLALALHGHEVGASIATEARVPAWNGSGRWSGPIQASVGSHHPVTLTVESLAVAVATTRRLDARCHERRHDGVNGQLQDPFEHETRGNTQHVTGPATHT
ncbi:hypothetical protein [Micromonospora zamorensis]|uniref:hypothetical protein n=1 Tax=Micromonospora zamorensis TaxID=709883 RepID=UPI00081FFAD2|nr:hypothetical protein [Micromonospora zamorensis]SCG45987.1 hypothetical protein GA0070619_1770 [Micromonospora zamorensis]